MTRDRYIPDPLPLPAQWSAFQRGFYLRIAALLSGYKALGRWPAIEGAAWLDELEAQ